jgi:erythromycin esterase-like protein
VLSRRLIEEKGFSFIAVEGDLARLAPGWIVT